jgi:CheY-like chemotaxis protein
MDEHSPNVRESLREISQATIRARDLVKRLLTFSRKQEQQRVVMQLHSIVLEVVSLLRASLPVTIEIEKRIDSECSTVLADPTQVHQVVMNLATNSAYAMREKGGRLIIAVCSFHVDAHVVRMHPSLKEGSYVRIEVTDTGSGMDKETQKRIFEPFFTTKPRGEGTGLGLSAVHGIMQNHDGVVCVYSEAGKGTTFHLYFPAFATNNDELPASSVEPIALGKGERVIFVDDESVIATVAEAMLRKAGYEPRVFQSAEAALAAFRAAPDEVAAVITDLTMPGMTGPALAAEIHKIRSDMPVILATGYFGTDDAKLASENQIRHVLSKPFSIKSLAAQIREALTRST